MGAVKLQCADYQVAWICPVSDLELLPSRLMLDDEHDTPEYDTAYDDNVYICGAIAGHNVVLATCPPGLTGNVNAGRVTGPMFKTFPGLRMAVLVGIGGGVPRSPAPEDAIEDVHLGDVVVGWPGDGGPACVYYDLGRWQVDGQFQTMGTIDRPDRVLLNGLARIVSDHEMGKSTFDEHRARLLASRHKKKFARPNLEHDRLFQATCHHRGLDRDGCGACDTAQIVSRPARTEEEACTLVFHRGRIASGNAVVRDGERRDQIRERCGGPLCIEMEAAGVDAGGRCLVIRGISDYSDSHKNDVWQSYAAGNAAAFARELLCKISPTVVRETSNLGDRVIQSQAASEIAVIPEDNLTRPEAIKPGVINQEAPEQAISRESEGRCILTATKVKTMSRCRGTVMLKRWPLFLHGLGLQGHVLSVTKFGQQSIRISFRIVVPGTTKAITLDVDAQLTSKKLSISPTILFDRTIPDNSEIISACARGDLDWTRNLFLQGKASVLDVTQNNTTLLYHAINSGNVDLVKFLLSEGAEPNRTFGLNQTSPLQWALFKRRLEMCRLLIKWNADGSYVSAMGWTPIFYLLEDHTEKNDMNNICTTSSFFSILSNDSLFLDLEFVDPNGRTILQRVACVGSGEDIHMLLALQAELSTDPSHPWEDPKCAINYAIAHDNLSAFVALAEFVPDLEYVSEGDGRSILHYAARQGRTRMVRYLLEVKNIEEFVPDFQPESSHKITIRHEQDTNYNSWAQETYDLYMHVLRGIGRIVVEDNGSESGEQDIFWNCNETWKFN